MLNECIKFFKEEKGYNRIFQQMKEKWLSYGKVSGTIIIHDPKKEEREAVKIFFGKKIEGKELKFKMSDFERALKESKFSQITMHELLEGYFKEKLISKKEKNLLKEKEKSSFFEEIKERLKEQNEYSEQAESLLNKIISEKNNLYKYEENNKETADMIFFSIKAVNFLLKREKSIKLAILSAVITSNPHYFDRGTTEGNFFIYLLCSWHDLEFAKESEKILEIYYMSKIEVDSISSFTTAFNISLFTEEGIHKAYEEFIRNSEDYVITLSNLKKITGANCVQKKVFVVENQMVFSYICEYFKNTNTAFLCTAGQPKTASLVLLDMLCKAECTIYYSGDIDPEGIEIADKLIKRGKGKIIPWGFSLEDYEINISNKIISDESMKKIKKITNPFFIDLIKRVAETKRAGYQELLINKMIQDIKKIIGIR